MTENDKPRKVADLVPPASVPDCVHALRRFLFFENLEWAERTWYQQSQFPEADDSWTEVIQSDGTSWYIRNGKESGEFSLSRPDCTNMTTVVDVKDCPITLQRYLAKQIEFLPMHMREVADEQLYFLTHQPNQSDLILSQLECLLRSKDKFVFIRELRDRIEDEYLHFRLCGIIACHLFLLAELLSLFSESEIESFARAVILHPRDEFRSNLDLLATQPLGLAHISAVAHRLMAGAEQELRRCPDAEDFGNFYGKLFQLRLPFESAYLCFRFLTETTRPGADGASCLKLSRVSDEYLAHLWTSMRTAFMNSMDMRVAYAQRHWVTDKRNEQGEGASQLAVLQLIKVKYLYPAYVKPWLLRKVETFNNTH